jgi:PAS domain S-box-containing protein
MKKRVPASPRRDVSASSPSPRPPVSASPARRVPAPSPRPASPRRKVSASSPSPRPRVSASNPAPRLPYSELRARLQEAEETLRAIREGEVDAVVVSGAKGERVYSLSGAETIYRQAAETMAEAVLAVSPEGRIVFCNPRLTEFLRVPQGSLLGRPLVDFVPVEDRVQLAQMVEQAKARPVRRRLVLAVDGRALPVRVSASPLSQPDGIGVCIVATDLTEVEETVRNLERLRNEHEALGESVQRLRGVLVGAAVGFSITDPDGRFAEVNPAFCRIVGYGPDELRRLTYRELVYPDDSGENERQARLLEAGEIDSFVIENRYVRKDGRPVWVRKSVSQVRDLAGTVQGHVAFVEDITEQKQAVEALVTAHRQTQDLIDNTTALVYACDLEERFVLANAALAALLRTTPAQLLGKRRHEFMPQADADAHEAADRKVIAAGRAVEFEEHSDLHGRSITWLSTKLPLRDAQGRIYAVAGIVTDISARKQAEEALRASELRLETVLAGMTDCYYTLDKEWRFSYVNPTAEKFFDRPKEKVIGQCIWELYPAVASSLTGTEYRRAMAEGKPAHFETQSALSNRYWNIHAYPGPEGLTVYLSDITERRRAEESLREAAQELKRSNEDLEQYAYVASHDLQEPLRMVANYVELLGQRYKGKLDDKADRYIKHAADGAVRMQGLIHDLLTFSRVGRRDVAIKPVNLNRVVEQAMENVRTRIEESGTVVDVGLLPVVSGDEIQLVQLFQNLLTTPSSSAAPSRLVSGLRLTRRHRSRMRRRGDTQTRRWWPYRLPTTASG